MNLLRRLHSALRIPRSAIALAANEAAPAECDHISAANELKADADNWVILAPYGDHDNSVGLQRFRREDAENIVNEFKRLANLPTRLLGLPFYIGHPDHDAFKARYTDTRAYGRIKQLKATETGLAANVKWSDAGRQLIESEAFHGHSVNWAMRKEGNVWRPFRLKSVGFTNEPNIPVPPVTAANELPGDSTTMNKTEILNWLKSQGIELPPEATDDQIKAALMQIGERLTSAANEATTAKARVTELTGQLTAAEARATAATTTAANERKERAKLLLDHAVTEGRLTAAERPALEAEFANEVAFDATVAKLAARTRRLHTQPVSAGLGQRNADTRSKLDQIQTAVNERMRKDGCTYQEAFVRLRQEKHALFVDAANGK